MTKIKISGLLITIIFICSLFYGAVPIFGRHRASAARQAKRTLRGNFCGQQSGNRSGDFYFRVGRAVRVFNMAFGLERGNAKIIGFKFNELKIGNEYLIVYRSDDGENGFIESIKFTGRNKKIEPCSVG